MSWDVASKILGRLAGILKDFYLFFFLSCRGVDELTEDEDYWREEEKEEVGSGGKRLAQIWSPAGGCGVV